MDAKKIVIFLILAFVLYTYLIPWIGVSGFLASIFITVGLLAAVRTFLKVNWAFPTEVRGLFVVVILALGALFGGMFSFASLNNLSASMVSGEQIVQPIGQVTQPITDLAACDVSSELKGKAVNLKVNAWNQESNTPYSAAVDMTTSCWYYVNGIQPADFSQVSADTSDEDIATGFVVGDKLYVYCGGTSYYTDPVEGMCLETQSENLNINIHAIEAESDMQITAYDDSEATALSSGTTYEEDYYITQGAGAEDTVYLKLKVNSADAAYDHCAWGTMALTNLTSFVPNKVTTHGVTYTKVATPLWASDVAVKVDEYGTGSTTFTSSYTVYKLDKAIRLHEWESLKTQFIATASENDPVQEGDNSTTPAKYIALSMDCQYARGTDGVIYYDIHDHTSSEGDVGLAETETSPLGAAIGVVIEAR